MGNPEPRTIEKRRNRLVRLTYVLLSIKSFTVAVLMPGRILTDRERKRLEQFPAQVAPSDLATYFTLSSAQLNLVCQHRGDRNRLGFALQLLTLRYLGFCPDRLTTVPADVVAYVAGQLNTTPEALVHYGKRAQTRTDHFQKVQAYPGFRPAKLKELRALTGWLLERALEHDKPMYWEAE
ncbi:MAG: hypothetical protein CLLPBCKN_006558 [Chroococcidiopsis cubana SAG 39.79]|nr:DUF4158 domain-containing protein [Chroococcidiopsis cubana]MDZ4877123.1 hypothetical protein [Chroococcidiopsis cubana SAG 39.79]PSB60829.1 hypothetical protein C7B79_24280 [Chroococcidiopsis cubana CCALA 043]